MEGIKICLSRLSEPSSEVSGASVFPSLSKVDEGLLLSLLNLTSRSGDLILTLSLLQTIRRSHGRIPLREIHTLALFECLCVTGKLGRAVILIGSIAGVEGEGEGEGRGLTEEGRRMVVRSLREHFGDLSEVEGWKKVDESLGSVSTVEGPKARKTTLSIVISAILHRHFHNFVPSVVTALLERLDSLGLSRESYDAMLGCLVEIRASRSVLFDVLNKSHGDGWTPDEKVRKMIDEYVEKSGEGVAGRTR